jgi:hypothetical protein
MLEVVIDRQGVQIGQRFAVSFQRTLRIPDDGRTYPLPPGLGQFPVFRVQDYSAHVPDGWQPDAGFIPLYQREALWLGFRAAAWQPNAVKLAVGGVNVITGEPDDDLLREPQNYIVCPPQLWLDGIHTTRDAVRQFVAMSLGAGYTVEASMTGAETVGGIQMVVFEPKPGKFPDQPPEEPDLPLAHSVKPAGFRPMGLGAGGAIQQKIYPDPYGIETWDQSNYGRAVIHLVNRLQFQAITRMPLPPTPIDVKTYTDYGLPWFELYDETAASLPSNELLNQVRTIAETDAEYGEVVEDESFEVSETQIEKLEF